MDSPAGAPHGGEPHGGSGEQHGHGHQLPAWLRPGRGEHRWPAAVAVLALIALQLALPANLALRPFWLLPAIEFVLLVVLVVADPGRVDRESSVLRGLGLALAAVASLATALSAYRLIAGIAADPEFESRVQLFVHGGTIWLTNVIVFALWYWELDRGGPAARAHARRNRPDFLFPQMTAPHVGGSDWEPEFVDYLYVSFTNATAFSPTDTMPLTRWAKLAMMFEAAMSFVVVVLVIARAVNLSQ